MKRSAYGGEDSVCKAVVIRRRNLICSIASDHSPAGTPTSARSIDLSVGVDRVLSS